MKLALAGDTMLGRRVADALTHEPGRKLVSREVVEAAAEADLFVLNLECCISERGERWPDPDKPFFFRAPPVATETLVELGVDCVTLANNHALDYGADALLDTFEHLRSAGIAYVGAGATLAEARAPAVLVANGFRLLVVALSDHPAEYAATSSEPGIAYSDLAVSPLPDWVADAVHTADADAVLVTPHWGPNMVAEPVPHVRRAAAELVRAGATLVAGHSAHVFHGVSGSVLFDLGDFLDDYAVHPGLRNDLGLLFLVELDPSPRRLEAIPLKLDYCYTQLARSEERKWIARRFREACAPFDTEVSDDGERLVVDWRR